MTAAARPIHEPDGKRARAARWLRRLHVGAATAGAAAILAITFLEGGPWQTRSFTAAAYGYLFAALCLLTGRWYFSAIAAAAMPVLVFVISRIKHQLLGEPLLFFDLVYLMRSNFLELMRNDLRIGAAVVAAAVVLIACFAVSWRLDRRRSRSIRVVGPIVVASSGLVLISYPQLQRFDEMDLISWNHRVATFALSATRTGSRLEPRPAGLQHVPVPHDVTGSVNPNSFPDIIIVLEESTFDFRELATAAVARQPWITEFFEPNGGKHGRLRVHTFGGQTWLAEFALLTAIPHTAFGPNGNYAPYQLEGRIKASVPRYLHQFGYRTMAVYPTRGSFVNGRRFYRSIGFDDFVDPSDLAPPRSWDWRTTDDEILSAALDVLATRRTGDTGPGFLIVLTINQHGPHPRTPAGEALADAFNPGRVPSESAAAFGEYFSRFQHSATALSSLVTAYRAGFPGRPALILHFGDHHPSLSKETLPQSELDTVVPKALMQTYYAMIPINFELKPSPLDALPELDIAMLPAHLLASAGLPLDDVWTLRTKLAAQCQGLYADCTSPTKTELHGLLLSRGLVLD